MISRIRCSAALLIVALWGGTDGALGQDNIALVQGLIAAAYPDLARQDLKVMIIRSTAFDAEWSRANQTYVQVHRGTPILLPAERAGREWLGVSVLIDHFGEVSELRASGQYVHSSDGQRLLEQVQRRGPSPQRIARELARLNAKYTPEREEDFVRSLDLALLEPFLGPVVSRRVSFYPLTDGDPDRPQLISVTWSVEIETKGKGGERQAFILQYEPFSGRLVRLMRHFTLRRR